MKQLALILLVGAAISLYVGSQSQLNQDLLSSIKTTSGEGHQELFEWFNKNGPFQGKIFLEPKKDEAIPQEIIDALAEAGYHTVNLSRDFQISHGELLKLLPFSALEGTMSFIEKQSIEDTANKIMRLLSLPAGEGAKTALKDPFFLYRHLLDEFDLTGDISSRIQIFERKDPLQFDRIEPLYTSIVGVSDKIHWIGGDFFAYENYRAIKRDIWFCTIISLILCGIVFNYFCRSFWLLGVLALGTWYSLTLGLYFVGLFYESIFSIVLAFTSTFIGFNNEYLIHLSGFNRNEWRQHITGLGSAIGTTLIGFLALLFSNTVISKQFGLVSIGGMAGFIGIMLLMQKQTATVRYRELNIPKISINPRQLACLAVVALIAVSILGSHTSFSTDVKSFRFASPLLASQAEFFGNRLDSTKFQNPQGLEYHENNLRVNDIESAQSFLHPLTQHVPENVQKDRVTAFRESYIRKNGELESVLRDRGVALPPPQWIKNLEFLSAEEYLAVWNKLGPLPWGHKVGSRMFTVFYPNKKQLEDAFPLGPKSHYDTALSKLGRQMGVVFLIALAVMFLYLLPWQISISKVTYIFMPLILSSIAIFSYLHLVGESFNLIHMMGMILVIALALDYGSLVISSSYGAQARSKVLLTGLASAISFGSLLFAHHPVIQNLGVVVFLGTAVSLVFSLTIQLTVEN